MPSDKELLRQRKRFAIVLDGERARDVLRAMRALLQTEWSRRESLDLNVAVREVAGLARRRMGAERATIEVELADGMPAVAGDRIQLQQVMFNLVLNAADAMIELPRRQRRIVLATRVNDAGEVELQVRDRGCAVGA